MVILEGARFYTKLRLRRCFLFWVIHGLSVQVSRDLKLDNVAPVVAWTPPGDSRSLPGNAGWCRAAQNAVFTTSDPTSGLANLAQASFIQSTGTNGSAVLISSGSVMDQAGNVNLGVNAGPYQIDSVAQPSRLTIQETVQPIM
jgi:hypothetical protein